MSSLENHKILNTRSLRRRHLCACYSPPDAPAYTRPDPPPSTMDPPVTDVSLWRFSPGTLASYQCDTHFTEAPPSPPNPVPQGCQLQLHVRDE